MIIKMDVARVFPATDPVAIDLLRLMCGCCDLFHVTKWILGSMQRPKEFGGVVIAHGKTMLQFRLLASYLHESLSVLHHLIDCPGFEVLRSLLPLDNIRHLAELHNIKLKGEGFTSKDWGVSEVIRRSRHTASFHYDIKETQEALNRWTTDGFRFGKEGYFVVELDKNQEKAWSYYAIADLVRAEISFGLTNENLDKNNKDLLDLVGRLTGLVQRLFFAYVDHRNLHDFVSRRGP